MKKPQVRVRRRKPRRSQVEQAASECTQSRWRCPELENPEFAWLLRSRLILALRVERVMSALEGDAELPFCDRIRCNPAPINIGFA
jgi:hypothetical protein